MDIEIDLEKSLEQNASAYYEKSKQAKKKLAGLKKAMPKLKQKALKKEKKHEKKDPIKKKTKWFQEFHWFKTSEGFLVVGGKDAKSNETITKKHFEEKDLFLHADIQGGSACIIKSNNKEIPENSQKEAAQFAAARSKAWQQKLASVDVYAATKEQVSKKAPTGESIGTGAFMIYGKRKWFRKTPLRFSIGIQKTEQGYQTIAGPPTATKKHGIIALEISHGSQKKSDTAKQVLAAFEKKTGQKNPVTLEEITAMLPGENLSIKQRF